MRKWPAIAAKISCPNFPCPRNFYNPVDAQILKNASYFSLRRPSSALRRMEPFGETNRRQQIRTQVDYVLIVSLLGRSMKVETIRFLANCVSGSGDAHPGFSFGNLSAGFHQEFDHFLKQNLLGISQSPRNFKRAALDHN